MARHDEPVDLVVSFVEVDQEFGVRLEERDAGETREPFPRTTKQDLEIIALERDKLDLDGGRLYQLAQLGQRLFGLIFDGINRDLFVRSSDTAQRYHRPLRLIVKMPHHSELERVPWEILHDGTRFLAKDPRCAVVRYLTAPQNVPAFRVAQPLRILLTSACPPPQPELGLDAEVESIRMAYRDCPEGAVTIDQAPNVSARELEELCRSSEANNRPFHVWHHCGHGHLTTEEGKTRFYLSLDGGGKAEYITVDKLVEIIGNCPELRLAVLNVCHGGSFVGLAPEIARLNVPVVVSFPSRIANDMAHVFAAVLHQNLLRLPIELAVSQARKAVCLRDGGDLDWSKPMVFSRRRDVGRIVEFSSEKIVAEPAGLERLRDRDSGGARFGGTIDEVGSVTNLDFGGKSSSVFDHKIGKAESLVNVSGFTSDDLKYRDDQMNRLLDTILRRRDPENRHER
jgi:hypothetical protein